MIYIVLHLYGLADVFPYLFNGHIFSYFLSPYNMVITFITLLSHTNTDTTVIFYI